jgi:hypothetical protein
MRGPRDVIFVADCAISVREPGPHVHPALLSRGQTNREIASSLYISPSTAGVHISNILRKLGAKRRVDAAGLAHSLGLLSATS